MGLKRHLEEKLTGLLMRNRGDDDLANIIDIRIQLNLKIDKDEAYWEQHARVNWLLQRDKHTSFFHCFASTSRKKNKIEMLIRAEGTKARNEDEIGWIAKEYFQILFTSNHIGS